jgi:hypothetical protein
MYPSKLIRLYSCFDSRELEALHKWEQFPLHNRDSKVQELVFLLSSKRQLTPNNTQKKRLFKVLFPQENYNDLQWRRLVSKTVQCLEHFVQFWMQKQKPIEAQKNLLLFLQQRQRPKLAQQQLQKTTRALDKTTVQTHAHYYQHYQLQMLAFEADASQARMQATNLQHLVDNLSVSFMIETLRLAFTAYSHQRIYKTDYRIPFLTQVVEQAQQEAFQHSTALQLYLKAYQSIVAQQDAAHFEPFKAALLKHASILSSKEQRSLYNLAINYCIRQINSDESHHYMQQVFELYQQGINNQILLSNGRLSRFAYKNIVAVGLRLHAYDWIKDFIETYAAHVEARFRENHYHYNLCKWYFAIGDYDKAMQRLVQVEYDDLFLNLDAKTTLMKIYYETQNFGTLEAFFHSFGIYLQHKDILGYHRENYQNILRHTKKLLALTPYDHHARASLQRSIAKTQPLTERPWLLEQLARL